MTKREVHARLIGRGYTFRSWALARGYKVRTVSMTVERWAGRTDAPRGRLTYRILRDLSREIDAEIIGGCLAEKSDLDNKTPPAGGRQ